jgi:hypothetical protein
MRCKRPAGGQHGAGNTQQYGLFQRRQQLAELPDLAAPGDQPFAQGEQRHAQGQHTGHGLQTEGEHGEEGAQPDDALLTGAAGTDPRIACMATCRGLSGEHRQATQG